MQIAPPFGYKQVRLLAPGEVPEFARHGNAIPISHTEFQPVARDYPIVSPPAMKARASLRSRARHGGRRKYEADLERSREMCAILADDGVLEPFTMQATLNKGKGGAMHLTGMHRVSEKNLENLNAAQLKNLLRKGCMARIYLHLQSLENFARLLERKSALGAPA